MKSMLFENRRSKSVSFIAKSRKLINLMTNHLFDMGYYREAESARLMNLFAHIDLEQWQGMSVLEVGAGVGNIGKVFINMGFDVTSTDGRPEYVEKMKSEGRKAFVLDLDNTSIDEVGQFDIILSFGVLYHLSNPEKHLLGCHNAKILVLESLVCDTSEPVVIPIREKKGWRGKDQALNELGCRPSPSWIEQKIREAGFSIIRDISNPNANWVKGKFDWVPKNSNLWKVGDINYRKMWVCEKVKLDR